MPCDCNDPAEELLPETLFDDINGVAVPSTPFLIPLCVTPEQYQLLVDSLEFARGLYAECDCFDERVALEILLAGMRHVNDPISGGEPCMDVCDIVTGCVTDNSGTQAALAARMIFEIENNTNVGQAITEYLSERSASGQPMPDTTAASPIEPASTFQTDGDCDRDKFGGGCQYLVHRLEDLITDFFEITAVTDDNATLAAKVVSDIPVVGGYAASAVEFAVAMRDKLADTFAAQMTDEIRDEITCAYLNRNCPDCELSIDDVIAIHSERAGQAIPEDMLAFMVLVIEGTFVTIQIVDMAFALAACAMKFGQQFGAAIGIKPLAAIMRMGASNPVDSADLCDDCPDMSAWEIEYDLTTVNGGLYIPDDFEPYDAGVWNSGTGWQTEDVSGSRILTVAKLIPMTADSVLTGVELDFELTGGSGGNSAVYIGSFSSSNLPTAAGTYTNQEIGFSEDLSSGDVEVIIRLDRITGESTLTRVRYFGTGTLPTV